MVKTFIYLFVSGAVILGDISPAWSNLEGVTKNNATAATQRFNRKLLKGKLEEREYSRLREVIGPMGLGEELQIGEVMSVVGSSVRLDNNISENQWFVPVYKTLNGVRGEVLPLFTAVVRCDIYRTRIATRAGPRHQWYPDCAVDYVLR